MNWDDTGYLLSKSKYNENSLISEIFTKDHGKVAGIIFGGTSRRIKNYLQIGNRVYLNFNSKSENRIGYFKIEIQQAFTPYYFDNKKKLSCISSAIHLVKVLTAESQKNTEVFDLIKKFYSILEKDNWIKEYVYWELELLKVLGYHLQFENLIEKKIDGSKVKYFSKSLTNKKIIPNFLIDKDHKLEDLPTLLNGLKIVGDYLDKTIFKPNNILHPISREQFISTLR